MGDIELSPLQTFQLPLFGYEGIFVPSYIDDANLNLTKQNHRYSIKQWCFLCEFGLFLIVHKSIELSFDWQYLNYNIDLNSFLKSCYFRTRLLIS